MKLWLCVCALTISAGCASVNLPDVDPYFEKYALHQVRAPGVRTLPPAPEVRIQQDAVVLDDEAFRALEVFVETAYGLQEQLGFQDQEIQALQQEVNLLILAGRFTETRARFTQRMYEREAVACQWSRLAVYGLSAGTLVLLGGAL